MTGSTYVLFISAGNMLQSMFIYMVVCFLVQAICQIDVFMYGTITTLYP
jgi:hypothetical protein